MCMYRIHIRMYTARTCTCMHTYHSEILRPGMYAPLASCQRELTLSTKSRQREEASDGLKCLVLSAAFLRGNGVTRRTQKVIQGGDNGHVGRPCEVSPAPPCPELFCELRGLCRHSYFGPRTCSRSEKPMSSK